MVKIINLRVSGRGGSTESYANYFYRDRNTYPEFLSVGKFRSQHVTSSKRITPHRCSNFSDTTIRRVA
jgi:hypothetical protein